MRIRAVDLDALQGVGSLFPALFVPVDPKQPGWNRKYSAPLLQEWLEMLPGS
jgi:hypothetical protein